MREKGSIRSAEEGKWLHMRKLIIGILLSLCLAGCMGGNGPETESRYDSMPGDYNEDTGRLLKTDKGYYYYSYAKKGYCYVDKATGNDMILCNKPECKHDGNPFCVATNDKYMILGQHYIYDGRLIVAVVEETDTNYEFKLLELALDGSEASEICTYYKMVKDGFVVTAYGGYKMYVHRDKAFLPMNVNGIHEMEDTERFGVAIVDLKTGEVSYLDEEPLSTANIPTTNISAYGDYFYYCREEGKKTVLHRYSLTDKTDMTHNLLVGFHGEYAVADDEHIIYLKGKARYLCTYHYETGENKEALHLKRTYNSYEEPGRPPILTEEEYTALSVAADENYYYVAAENLYIHDKPPEDGGQLLDKYECVYVYNRDLEKVAEVNMAVLLDEVPRAEEGKLISNHMGLQYIGDRVYWNIMGQGWQYWYSCPKSEFVTGNPQFESEYRAKTHQWN